MQEENKSSENENLNSAHFFHSLPCDINYTGPVDSEKYFFVHKRTDGKYSAQLRGRELTGKIVPSPKSHVMSVIGCRPHTHKNPTEWAAAPLVKVGGEEPQLLAWTHCSHHPSDIEFKKALNWIEISDVLHGFDD